MRIEGRWVVSGIVPLRGTRGVRATGAPEESDQVSVSKTAEDLRVAYEALRDTPEVREQDVQNLREQLARGEYRVDKKAIADKLLGWKS